MMAFDDALEAVLAMARPRGAEHVDLAQAEGRVLARPLVARSASPATDVSAMDGYAALDADLQVPGAALTLAGEARPGSTPSDALAPGLCLRVFTGAPAPLGASRIVLQEEVRREGDVVIFPAACPQRMISAVEIIPRNQPNRIRLARNGSSAKPRPKRLK